MLRLSRYFKPYVLLILLTIALLFVQANCDLALPDYMSRIVNTGIQQGGVESAVPAAMRASQLGRVSVFMNAEDRAFVLAQYTLVDSASPAYAERVRQYPQLSKEPVYVLQELDKATSGKLSQIIAKPLLVVSAIEQAMSDPAKGSAMAQTLGFDPSKLPAGSDLFAVLSRLPPAQLEQLSAAIGQQFATLGESMVTQMAVSAVKSEYAALGVDTGKLSTDYIVRMGLLMLLVSLISISCVIVVSYLSALTAAGAARTMRHDVFARVESFSNAEFDTFSTASLITRSTNDITQIQMVIIMMMRMVIYAPIIGIGGVIRALGKSTSMWWIIALAVLVLLGLIVLVFSIALPKFKIIQSLIDRLNLVTREHLSGMMVIRAFNMQGFEEKRFDKANADLTSTLLFINRVMVIMMPLMMMVMNALSLVIIWVGAHQVAESRMQVGDMMAFLQYAMQIVFAFLMLSMLFIFLPRAAVSAGRVADVLETDPVIKDPPAPRQFKSPFTAKIEFRNVSFRYPGAEEDVLHDVSFTALPGQTTAFIGPTGSGKSTVVNLIPRFYDVTAGAIEVDGVDIRQVTQHDLRDKIGYIPQKSNLFSGTIESNLRYADENASQETLRESVETAQAGEFVFAGSEGLAAEISEGGANVSGGQKQRLSIARALVKKPPIYIFDDTFSALDFKTDSALRRALKEKTTASAVLIVTQRVSTIKSAEQIVVLDDGKVVGKGTHHELMQTCETYREIALSQHSKEELS